MSYDHRNCLNCGHNCDDHSSLDFNPAVQYMKHFIYHFTVLFLIEINWTFGGKDPFLFPFLGIKQAQSNTTKYSLH